MGRAIAIVLMSAALARAGTSSGPPAPGGVLAVDGSCPPTAESIAAIQSRYDSIRDFRARFEQRTRSVVLAGSSRAPEELSRGEVILAKPGRMRWEYREPEPSFVISDGASLWVYDVGARQATRVALDGGYLAGAALQLLFGEVRIGEIFEGLTTSCGPEGIVIELRPKEAASYERLTLVAQPGTGLVISTSIIDLFGNRTSIRFSELEFDRSPSPEMFEFTRPEGVEVLDYSQSP